MGKPTASLQAALPGALPKARQIRPNLQGTGLSATVESLERQFARKWSDRLALLLLPHVTNAVKKRRSLASITNLISREADRMGKFYLGVDKRSSWFARHQPLKILKIVREIDQWFKADWLVANATHRITSIRSDQRLQTSSEKARAIKSDDLLRDIFSVQELAALADRFQPAFRRTRERRGNRPPEKTVFLLRNAVAERFGMKRDELDRWVRNARRMRDAIATACSPAKRKYFEERVRATVEREVVRRRQLHGPQAERVVGQAQALRDIHYLNIRDLIEQNDLVATSEQLGL